jgi:hypothetical protein
MRGIFIAMLIAFGIGFVGTSPTLGAPVSGAVIDKAAQLGQVVERAISHRRLFPRRFHRHHWRHHGKVGKAGSMLAPRW